jgi:hypothetical protein
MAFSDCVERKRIVFRCKSCLASINLTVLVRALIFALLTYVFNSLTL